MAVNEMGAPSVDKVTLCAAGSGGPVRFSSVGDSVNVDGAS